MKSKPEVPLQCSKKPYSTPKLTVHGHLEAITLGEGRGIRDLFVFGLSDPIGRPPPSTWS
jgi:hypothetical protein